MLIGLLALLLLATFALGVYVGHLAAETPAGPNAPDPYADAVHAAAELQAAGFIAAHKLAQSATDDKEE